MQTLLPNSDSQGPHSRIGWGFYALALLVLSLGIGATTAAFTVIAALLPHSAAYSNCNTAVTYAYQASMDAAESGVALWIDDAGGIADAVRVLLLGAAALALLVACSNRARALYARSGRAMERSATSRAAAATVGALFVAAVLLRAMSWSSVADILGSISAARLDIRAIAFAACVSAAVEARRPLHPRITTPSSARP